MTKMFSVAVTLGLLVGSAAFAADIGIGNPAFTTPNAPESAPGMPAPNVVNTDDRLFIRAFTIGGRAEVQLGELAVSKGQNRMVVDFARRMITEHQAGNRQAADLAMHLAIPQPPGLDGDHQNMVARLEGLSGGAFDLEYIRTQIIDHQTTAHLLEWEIGSGENDQLRSFAADLLPQIMMHLQIARAVEDTLLGRLSDVSTTQNMRAMPR
jgi:putative membrane protein